MFLLKNYLFIYICTGPDLYVFISLAEHFETVEPVAKPKRSLSNYPSPKFL